MPSEFSFSDENGSEHIFSSTLSGHVDQPSPFQLLTGEGLAEPQITQVSEND